MGSRHRATDGTSASTVPRVGEEKEEEDANIPRMIRPTCHGWEEEEEEEEEFWKMPHWSSHT